jgi:CubicO group peptidase (beta-lactamase class C family)
MRILHGRVTWSQGLASQIGNEVLVRYVTLLLCLFGSVSALPAEPDTASVDRIFASYDKPTSPGCALGVIHNGGFVYRRGYGQGSLELAVPLTSESVFYMGSISKQFTAASVVIAAHRGLLSLDDDVHKYIPELPDYGHPITLRQMLNHTSGFRDVLTLLAISGRNAVDIHPFPEMLDLVTRQKGLNFAPGEQYLYSNTNYFLLAEVVHRVSKQPLSRFAEENIFRPLQMTHTRFYDDHNIVVPGRVAGYAPGPGGSFFVDWSTNFDKVGDGGLMSSVDDLLRWDQNFYDDKLADGSVAQDLQVRGRLNNGKEIEYALGLDIGDYRGLPTVEHGGSLFGYSTELLRFPQQHFTVICLCNLATANPGSLAYKVADLYLEAEFRKPAQSTQPQVIAREKSAAKKKTGNSAAQFAGIYEGDAHELTFFVAAGEDLAFPGRKPRILNPTSPGHFTFEDLTIEFKKEGEGITSVRFLRDGETIFSGVRIEVAHPDEGQLAAYAGNYHSDELDADFALPVAKGKLIWRTRWQEPLTLEPLGKDEFNAGGMVVVFRRDPSDKITGFAVYSGRASGMQFDRKGP